MFERLDVLTVWQMNRMFDLTDEQEEQFEPVAVELREWIREEGFPRLIIDFKEVDRLWNDNQLDRAMSHMHETTKGNIELLLQSVWPKVRPTILTFNENNLAHYKEHTKEQRDDWFKSVQRGLKILNAYCESVIVIGFSTGGALALKLAAENRDRVVAVIAVAVPVKFVDKSFLFVPFLHGTNKLVNWMSSAEGVKSFMENSPEHKDINYRNVPVKSLYELRRLMDDVLENKLHKIEVPTLVIYADKDPIVDSESAEILMAKLGSINKKLISIQSNRHGVLMENIGGTWESINHFLENEIVR